MLTPVYALAAILLTSGGLLLATACTSPPAPALRQRGWLGLR